MSRPSRVSFDSTPAESCCSSLTRRPSKEEKPIPEPLSPETVKACAQPFTDGVKRNRTKVMDEFEARADKTRPTAKICAKRIDAISRPDPPKKPSIHDEQMPEELPMGSTVLKLKKVISKAQELQALDFSEALARDEVGVNWADGLRLYAPSRIDLEPLLEPILAPVRRKKGAKPAYLQQAKARKAYLKSGKLPLKPRAGPLQVSFVQGICVAPPADDVFAENHRLRTKGYDDILDIQPDSTIPPIPIPTPPKTPPPTPPPTPVGKRTPWPTEADTQRLSPQQIATYFGESGRDRFRGAFRRIAQQASYVTCTDDLVVQGPMPFDAALDAENEREMGLFAPVTSPRHRFLAELARLNLPPECLLIRPAPPRTRAEALLRPDSTALDLSHRSLGDALGEALARVLPALPEVGELLVAGNRWSDEALVPVLKACLTMPKLKTLDLSSNDLDGAAATQLALLLDDKKCGLVSLGAADADLDDAELAPVLEACGRLNTLEILDVSGNGAGGARDFNFATEVASAKDATRPHDRKAHHTVGNVGEARGWATSKQSFLNKRADLKLKVARSKILGGVAEGLELLTKSGCGCLELVACLGASASLTHVDLAWNRIGTKDGAVLGALLAHNGTLRNVSLAFNSLGDGGLQHLATSLTTNTTLQRLDVRANTGGPRCASVFARCLRSNETLTHLALDANPLGEEGVRAFARAAGDLNPNLDISLRDCLSYVKEPPVTRGFYMEEFKIGKGKKAIVVPAKRVDAEASRSLALAKARGSWGLELPDQRHREAYDADTLQKITDAQAGVDQATPLDLTHTLWDPEACRGFYQLELNDPYQRCVMQDVLELCAKRPGLSLLEVVMADGVEAERKPEHFKTKLTLTNEGPPEFGDAYAFPDPSDPGPAVCVRDDNEDDTDEILREGLVAAGRDASVRQVPRGRRHPVASYNRAEAHKMMKAHALVDAEGNVFKLPPVEEGGCLRFKIDIVPRAPSALEAPSAVGLASLAKFVREDIERGTPPEAALSVWTRDWRLLCCHFPRLIGAIDAVAKPPPGAILAVLIPRLLDPEGAEALVEELSAPQCDVLLNTLGRYACVFFGALNGRYALDLADPLEREVARRLAAKSAYERRWCLAQTGDELPIPPEGAPFVLDQPPVDYDKATEDQKAAFFCEGTAQRYASGALRNVSYGNTPLTGLLDDTFFGCIVDARKPRGVLRFDYASLIPVAEGDPITHAAFRRTLNECGLPLDAVVLAGRPARSYLEAGDEDADNKNWRARAKLIDERFLHDIDTGAHDPQNAMAFLEPASSLTVSTAVAPAAAVLRSVRADATGFVAGPAAAALRAVQRAGTFSGDDLGESGDPEAPATPESRLRETLAKARVDVDQWVDGACDALWAELSRRESCLGIDKGEVVRVAHAVRVRVVAGGRCVLRVRGLNTDQIDSRTFLGATLPVAQKVSGFITPLQAPATAAAALAKQAILEPLGLSTGKLVAQGPSECSVAPRAPHQLPGIATRVTYHFFDVVLPSFADRIQERRAEALLDAASRDPAEKWRFMDRGFGDDVPVPPASCATTLARLRRSLAHTKLTAAQLSVCTALFPAAAVDGTYYRDEVIASLAHLVVDFEQLEDTVKVVPCFLNEEAWRRIVRRLGVLNLKDPRVLGGTYNLHLQQPDERRCAGVLMTLVEDLSVVQPPDKRSKKEKKKDKKVPGSCPLVVLPPKEPTPGTAVLQDLVLRPTEKTEPEPGWIIPEVWRATKGDNVGIPTVGRLACAYAPGDRDFEDSIERSNLVEEQRQWFKVSLPRPPADA